jgi:hypothetical protein
MMQVWITENTIMQEVFKEEKIGGNEKAPNTYTGTNNWWCTPSWSHTSKCQHV